MVTRAHSPAAVVRSVRFALAHAPGLVFSGSKPRREIAHAGASLRQQLQQRLRSYEQAVAYPPHQVLIGNLCPLALEEVPRPWHERPISEPAAEGPAGVVHDEWTFWRWMTKGDSANLLRFSPDLPGSMREDLARARGGKPPMFLNTDGWSAALEQGAEPLYLGDGTPLGVMLPAHEEDESLAAMVLLENLAAKVTGALALEGLANPEVAGHLLGCGEEAVGDRYQRGGGNLAKAMGELAGCGGASATDVKSFCAGPLHAIVLGAAMVVSGLQRRVVVVGGGSLAKLGMKFRGHLDAGYPILEDVIAGVAIEIVADDGVSPVIDLTSATWHCIGEGEGPHHLAAALSLAPLEARGLALSDVDRYAVELHNPDITEPAGSGNVPEANYRILAAMAVKRGELERSQMASFAAKHGLPGFSPTQGHIASSVPYLGHAIQSLTTGTATRVQLVAKGSLFLGRMTQMSDGVSVLLERNDNQARMLSK